ncbi:hypothetical protein CsSME_00002849 [Camellia sinensis var. sinensis]
MNQKGFLGLCLNLISAHGTQWFRVLLSMIDLMNHLSFLFRCIKRILSSMNTHLEVHLELVQGWGIKKWVPKSMLR